MMLKEKEEAIKCLNSEYEILSRKLTRLQKLKESKSGKVNSNRLFRGLSLFHRIVALRTQVMIITAQPMPRLEDGGMAIVGECGKEYIETRNGEKININKH